MANGFLQRQRSILGHTQKDWLAFKLSMCNVYMCTREIIKAADVSFHTFHVYNTGKYILRRLLART